MKTKIRLYIGHKLTNATPQFQAKMDSLRTYLEGALPECMVLKFLGTKAGTCGDVYDKDIVENVGSCQLFVAIVDEESTGLGVEIGAALWRSKVPMLILYMPESRVSRLVTGPVDRNGIQMIERTYSAPPEAVSHIRAAIKIFGITPENGASPELFMGPLGQYATVAQLRRNAEHIPAHQSG